MLINKILLTCNIIIIAYLTVISQNQDLQSIFSGAWIVSLALLLISCVCTEESWDILFLVSHRIDDLSGTLKCVNVMVMCNCELVQKF
jgi:hypothetical protein